MMVTIRPSAESVKLLTLRPMQIFMMNVCNRSFMSHGGKRMTRVCSRSGLNRRQFVATAVGTAIGGIGATRTSIGAQSATPSATPAIDLTETWDLEELEIAGYQPSHAYQSPSYGYTVSWSDAWQ